MGDLYVFNTQYAYYNLGLRNDVKIVLASRFNQIAVRKNFQKSYPNVIVPKDINDKDYLSKLIELNQDHFPIFSVLVGNIPGKWYPYGMLYRLNTDKNPNETAIIKNSIEVYKNYHNPLKYKDKAENNFLFSDIFQTYANARIATGKYLLSNEMYPEAKFQFLEALKLDPAYGEIDKYLGIINLKLGNCLEAEKNFSQYDRKNYFKNKLEYYLLMEQNSKECFKDLKKADSYHREYLKEAAKLETPL